MSDRKTVQITYHMHLGNTTAETCIDLPMEAETADALVKGEYCGICVLMTPVLHSVVLGLAILQGYGDGTIQDIRYAEQKEDST